jgi:hypothetical protein
LLEAERGVESAEPMALFSQRGDGDRHRRAALRAAPLLGTLDEASCESTAAVLREHIEIADFAQAAPST